MLRPSGSLPIRCTLSPSRSNSAAAGADAAPWAQSTPSIVPDGTPSPNVSASQVTYRSQASSKRSTPPPR
jgi:hypothetical protein